MGGFPEKAPVQDVPPAVTKRPVTRPMAQDLSSRMRHPDVASELFFPLEHAAFDDRGRWCVNKGEVRAVRTQISGVRFQAYDPQRENLAPERQVQHDVGRLVRSVEVLREVPGHQNLVLTPKALKCRQPVKGEGTRVKFGMLNDPKGRYADDSKAAATCYRSIRKSIRRSGFVVVSPKSFDSATGLSGLAQWGSELLLRRRRRFWWWLLLLPLLLLFRRCDEPTSFFGVPIETKSLIVLVDKSGSMKQWFPVVQAEAKNVLSKMQDLGGTRYANIIAYDAGATSALGGITEIDDDSVNKLMAFLDGLQAGGGTNLESGILEAAKQVAAHERPTTLVILTDGQDNSIAQMLGDMKSVLSKFDGVEIVGNTLTPRLFGQGGDPAPQNGEEHKLQEFAKGMNGRFGPEGSRP